MVEPNPYKRLGALDGILYLSNFESGHLNDVGKKINGTLVKGWLYENQTRIVAETDGSGVVTKRFVYASRGNAPDYMIFEGVTYRIVTDHIGSIRYVLEASGGTLLQAMTYDELGNVLSDSHPGFQPFGFAGGLDDRDTRLLRFGARDYDARTGRWASADPIAFAGGSPNLFQYVHSDPINGIDPTGLTDLVFSGGFHIPVSPGVAVGPNFASSVPNYFDNLVSGNGVPLKADGINLDWAAGLIADVGVNAGFADLSGSGGCAAAPFSINLGLGTKGGVQIVPRKTIDPNRHWWDPAKYIDGFSIGIGLGVALPVNASASSGRIW